MRQKSELRYYQRRVTTQLYESDGVMAVLKMGAGKTIAALTAIRELIDDEHIRHALVIAPKRVAQLVWRQEAAAWAHTADLRINVLDGTALKRAGILSRADQCDITVVGVDNVQWLVDEMMRYPEDHPLFDLLVLDETSRFKDPKSKRGKALRAIRGRFPIRWGLTGTPRPNSLLDLWGPMSILTGPDPFSWPKSFYKWRQEHFYPTDFNGYTWAPLPGHDELVMAAAAKTMITLNDGEMPAMDPPLIVPEDVELPDEARAAYDSMERRLFTRHDEGDIVAVSAAVATGKLAQIANGFAYGNDGNADIRQLHDAKREWLAEKKEDLDGEPALLVYEYLADRDAIRKVFGDIPFLGQGTSDAAARRAVEAWNARKLPYLGLHPASGGHGLNLQTGGSRQLWVSPPWSPELWDQTIARLHRPGQTEQVIIHVCVAKNTIDDAKRSRVIDKLTAQETFEQYLRNRGYVKSTQPVG